VLATIERLVERVTRGLSLAGALALLGLAFLSMADILLRWLFKAPVFGLVDFIALAGAVIIAAYFPALIANRGNVTIRLLGSVVAPRVARWLDVFGALVTTLFFATMCWKYVEYSAEATSAGETSVLLRWPVGPWWWVVTILIGIAALVGLVVLAREIVGRPPTNGKDA